MLHHSYNQTRSALENYPIHLQWLEFTAPQSAVQVSDMFVLWTLLEQV